MKKKPGDREFNKPYQKSNFKKKKMLKDCNFCIDSSAQAADFQAIADQLINYIKSQKRGNDITEILKNLERIKQILGSEH